MLDLERSRAALAFLLADDAFHVAREMSNEDRRAALDGVYVALIRILNADDIAVLIHRRNADGSCVLGIKPGEIGADEHCSTMREALEAAREVIASRGGQRIDVAAPAKATA